MVTSHFFLLTLDEVDFLGLCDQEAKFLITIILDSISLRQLGSNPSKRVIILTLFLPFQDPLGAPQVYYLENKGSAPFPSYSREFIPQYLTSGHY